LKLIFVRHGETEANRTGRVAGQRLDEALNRNGLEQVGRLLSEIGTRHFDIVFSSTLLRAKETAEAIARRFGKPILFSDDLRERDFGSLSGLTWEEMTEQAGSGVDMKQVDFEQRYDYRPFGGESVDDVRKRLLRFRDHVKREYPGKSVLAVTHGGIIRLACHFQGGEINWRFVNASVHEFDL